MCPTSPQPKQVIFPSCLRLTGLCCAIFGQSLLMCPTILHSTQMGLHPEPTGASASVPRHPGFHSSFAAFLLLSYRSPHQPLQHFLQTIQSAILHWWHLLAQHPHCLFLVPGFRRHFLVTFNFRQKLVCCGWFHTPKFLNQARLDPSPQMLKLHLLHHVRIDLPA
jgi:hypothetical protein